MPSLGPKFRVGQLVHVDGQVDYVWERRHKVRKWTTGEVGLEGETFEPGWWYKMRYPGDCVEFHESCLTAIRPREIEGPFSLEDERK